MQTEVQLINILSKKQEKEIRHLLKACERVDKQKIDFFLESEWNEPADCPCFFLLYTGKQLDCAVSAFLIQGEAELSAITRPEKRGQGFFTKTIKQGISVLLKSGYKKFLFRIDAENRTANQIAKHWKAKPIQTDYLMKLTEYNSKIKGTGEIRCLSLSDISKMEQKLVEIYSSAFHKTKEDSKKLLKNYLDENLQLWEYQAAHQTIGICFVTSLANGYFLSAISVQKEKQGKGYGYQFLSLLLEKLLKKEQKTIFLEVQKENKAAVHLYQKIGFSVQQKLITYQLQN